MITEKQVRDALGGATKGYISTTLDALKAAGLIAPEPEPDKPLLTDVNVAVVTMAYGHGFEKHGTRTYQTPVIEDHQAALDEFAREVMDANDRIKHSFCDSVIGGIVPWTGRIDSALAAARKAGLTRVGAK